MALGRVHALGLIGVERRPTSGLGGGESVADPVRALRDLEARADEVKTPAHNGRDSPQ